MRLRLQFIGFLMALLLIAISLGTFSTLTEAQEVVSLPAGAWYPGSVTTHTLLKNINIAGQGQIAYVNPGQTISISYTIQIFANPAAPGEIRQAFFAYSWTSSWPPLSAYTPIYNGMPGLYPGETKSSSFTISVPTSPGTYKIWLCGGSDYSMNKAVVAHTNQPTTTPHGIIIVTSQMQIGATSTEHTPTLVQIPTPTPIPTQTPSPFTNRPEDYLKYIWILAGILIAIPFMKFSLGQISSYQERRRQEKEGIEKKKNELLKMIEDITKPENNEESRKGR
jgi:hypothetical protein